MTNHPVFSESMSSRYQVLKLINSGGKGLIYFARDSLLNRDVAIKVLKKCNSVQDLMVFQNEAKAIGQLNHLNIVLVHDFILNEQGHASMIMEFVEGTDLHQLVLNKGKVPLKEALPIFVQVCQGMDHAHNNGIIHRDMKSAKILLAGSGKASQDAGTVKIADFGLARYFSDDSSVSTGGGGNLIGTPAYISPEQAQGSKGDPRSDIYSFGCVMFEVLTGKYVFQSDTLAALALMHVNDAPPRLPRVSDSQIVQTKMQLIVSRCLEKEKEDRFASFRELETQLNEVKELSLNKPSRHLVEINHRTTNKSSVMLSYLCIGIIIVAIGTLTFIASAAFVAKKPEQVHINVSTPPRLFSTSLKQVHLTHLYKVTPLGLIAIIKMKSMRCVGVPAVRSLNEDVMSAVVSSKLTALLIGNSNANTRMVTMLKGAKQLQRLNVGGPWLKKEEVAYFKKLLSFEVNKPIP